MKNFDLRKYLAKNKLLKEEIDFPELEDEFEGAMDAMVVEPEVYLQDIIDASAEEIVSDDYYEIMNAVEQGVYSEDEAVKLAKAWAKEKLSNLSEGKLLKENAPGYDTRKTGEALPTLESVKAAYEAKNDITEDVIEEAYTFQDANEDNVKAIQKDLTPVLKSSIEKALMDWAKKNPNHGYGRPDFGKAVGMIAFDITDSLGQK